MIKLLKALVKGYPDRLQVLISAPISSIVQFVMNLLLPLMPGRLASKVVLKGAAEAKEKLLTVINEEDIPTFFGGAANHDEFYPDEGYCPNRGEGNLKFDYFGMCDRLQKAKQEWEATKASS
jgi:CRAL/TRIO domain